MDAKEKIKPFIEHNMEHNMEHNRNQERPFIPTELIEAAIMENYHKILEHGGECLPHKRGKHNKEVYKLSGDKLAISQCDFCSLQEISGSELVCDDRTLKIDTVKWYIRDKLLSII